MSDQNPIDPAWLPQIRERVAELRQERLWSADYDWFETAIDCIGGENIIAHLKRALIHLDRRPQWNNGGWMWNVIRELESAKKEAEKFCRDYDDAELTAQAIAEIEESWR